MAGLLLVRRADGVYAGGAPFDNRDAGLSTHLSASGVHLARRGGGLSLGGHGGRRSTRWAGTQPIWSANR